MHRPHLFVRGRFALALLALCVALQPTAFAAGASADARFDALGKRYVEEFGRYSPVSATQLGDHRFDGKLDDLSPSGPCAYAGVDQGGARRIAGRSIVPRLSRANQVDAAMLDNQLRYSIWSEEKFRDWSWDPLVYTQLAGQSAVRVARPRVRALARAPALGDEPARAAARPARTDARQHRALARARDPRRNGNQAEPGCAEPGGRTRRAERRAAARCGARAPGAGDRERPCRREDPPAVARKAVAAAGAGRFPHRSRTVRREAQFRADVATRPGRDPASRRKRGHRHAREDVRSVAQGAGWPRWRAPDTGRADGRRTAGRDPGRARHRGCRTDAARRCRGLRAGETARDDRVRPREELRDGARRAARNHPDARVPARRRGCVLRLARPARPGPAHVLRGVADSRRMDRSTGRLIPERVQHALDREPDDPRGDAGPLPADRALQPLSPRPCARCSARVPSSKAGRSTPSA